MNRKVEIRHEKSDCPWRLYWSGTDELADPRRFLTLDEAGRVARRLMGCVEEEPRRPLLERIG